MSIRSYQHCEHLAKRSKVLLERNTRLLREGDIFHIELHTTNIVTYRPDGTIRVTTGGWDTPVTRARIHSYSPINVFPDSQCKFIDKTRFGLRWRDSYPWPGTIEIAADGTVLTELVDEQRIIDPEKYAERRKLGREFRSKVLPRMLLLEFGDIWTKYVEDYKIELGFGRSRYDTGWLSFDMTHFHAREFVSAVMRDEVINSVTLLSLLANGNTTSPTKDQAIRRTCDNILREALDDPEWFTTKKIRYENVRINRE